MTSAILMFQSNITSTHNYYWYFTFLSLSATFSAVSSGQRDLQPMGQVLYQSGRPTNRIKALKRDQKIKLTFI